MDLNFYSDLSDGTGQHVDSEFMDNSSYSGYDPVNKFAGGNDSYLTISGPGHHWSSEKTFHTPCLGDEEFEIPPISLDPDSALTIEDVEAHFGELAEQAETSSASGVGNSLASNPVVGGNDPSFASAFMNPSSQGIEHLSMGVINQRGVYKRKTDAAKKEYLKALAAYRANQLSKSSTEVEDSAPSTPPSVPCPAPVTSAPAAPARPRLTPIPEQNTITNICASNIILDGPQVTTRSRTGSLPLAISQPLTPTVTKIIISKQMLGGSQIHQIPTSMVTVIPAALRAVQPAVAGRQPPPLQQMQGTPPPPRLQQMVQTQAPPPLQAKPRGGAGGSVAVTATPPPPLQIKIVPASLHSDLSTPIIVTTATSANPVIASTTISASAHPAPVEVQVEEPREELVTGTDEAVTEEPEEMEMEVSVAPEASSSAPPTNLCVRAGCTNPAVESRDWDKEYCSNECVATHCRDIFMAWCSIKSQNSATVK
ncbi:TOX high mobility group box family member 4-A-like [Sinocyclocheilus grahami]|uniref:TOX high mobility group box family member 4-A-like n=1 Tax=Sinocyclocheilus grahami TaxID=75366 RepID=UPI0007AD12D2|nr:PREDICTED: TOX high mobility group box family member 4-A-like [Sinocyclocheilus grahami]